MVMLKLHWLRHQRQNKWSLKIQTAYLCHLKTTNTLRDWICYSSGDFNLLNFLNNWIQVRTEDGWLNERYQYWFKTMNWQDQVNGLNNNDCR